MASVNIPGWPPPGMDPQAILAGPINDEQAAKIAEALARQQAAKPVLLPSSTESAPTTMPPDSAAEALALLRQGVVSAEAACEMMGLNYAEMVNQRDAAAAQRLGQPVSADAVPPTRRSPWFDAVTQRNRDRREQEFYNETLGVPHTPSPPESLPAGPTGTFGQPGPRGPSGRIPARAIMGDPVAIPLPAISRPSVPQPSLPQARVPRINEFPEPLCSALSQLHTYLGRAPGGDDLWLQFDNLLQHMSEVLSCVHNGGDAIPHVVEQVLARFPILAGIGRSIGVFECLEPSEEPQEAVPVPPPRRRDRGLDLDD